MTYKWLSFLPLSMVLLTAADQPQPWKDKQVPEWNDEDTKLILADSPWAKTVTPTIDKSAGGGQSRQGRGGGRGGGINLGGIMIGLPGGGMGRRGGGGYPGGGGGGAGRAGGQQGDGSADAAPPELHLRWESAFPIREAELKSHDSNAPTLDDDAHYAIAVYGVPNRMAGGASRSVTDQLKKLAAIKRDGKKDLKPSSVEVLQRDSGPVIVYLFPRSKEITRLDKRVEFDAKVGRLQFTQTFYVDDMIYRGKLEL